MAGKQKMSPSSSSGPLLGPSRPGDDQYHSAENSIRPFQHHHNGDTDVSMAGSSKFTSHKPSTSGSPRSNLTPPPSFLETEGSHKDYGNSETRPLLMEDSPPPYNDVGNPAYDKGRKYGANIISGSQTPLVNTENSGQPPGLRMSRSQEGDRRKGITRVAKLILGGVIAALLLLFTASMIRRNRSCSTIGFVTGSYQIEQLSHFEFSDDATQNSGLPNDFSGSIHLFSGPSDQSADLNVSIRSIASDFRRSTSGEKWRPRKLSDCAKVTLFFRPGLEISTFKIASQKMNIVLFSDLLVTEATTISVEEGNLVSKNFTSSRRTYIDIHKSTIRGTFHLHDLLSIKTRSSSVSIDILPQVSRDKQPQPAVLDIESNSGAVHINYPPEHADIPDRIYRSNITSKSGSISGKILHGQETEIGINSGDINAHILPYGFGTDTSFLTTKARSGSTRIVMLKPYYVPENTYKRIDSNHTTNSGELSLRYPDEWEGEIHGWVRSGNIRLRGRDVKIHEEARGGHYIYATKGRLPVSKLAFSIGSGNANVAIGSE